MVSSVAHFSRVARELSDFSAHHKSCTEFGSKDGTHHETAAFDTDHFGDALVFVEAHHFVKHFADAEWVFEKSGNVLKLDARLRKIGDVSQMSQ